MAARVSKKKFDLNDAPIRGILTASDSPFFPALKRLVVSLKKQWPMCVMDLGLSSLEVGWLESKGVQTVKRDWYCPKTVNCWHTWNKPQYIRSSPFDYTLWLDADCVVVGDLVPLFGVDPLIVRLEGSWPQNANGPHVYQVGDVAEKLPPWSLVNAGVVGFSKEAIKGDLFLKWERMCKAAITDYSLRKSLAHQDTGALIWAIEASGSKGLIRDQPGWNRVKHHTFKPEPTDVIHHYAHWSWQALPPVTE